MASSLCVLIYVSCEYDSSHAALTINTLSHIDYLQMLSIMQHLGYNWRGPTMCRTVCVGYCLKPLCASSRSHSSDLDGCLLSRRLRTALLLVLTSAQRMDASIHPDCLFVTTVNQCENYECRFLFYLHWIFFSPRPLTSVRETSFRKINEM